MNDEIILLELVYRTTSGKSLSKAQPGLTIEQLKDFSASEETQKNALKEIKRIGLTIVVANERGASVSGSKDVIEKIFGVDKLKVPNSLAEYIEEVKEPTPGEFY